MRGSRMKKVILNILHLLLNVVLAASLFVSCWCFLTPYFRVNRNTQGDAFRNLPADTVQVLAVGSSHMQYAFNPGVYYAMTGAYSYVFASVCQPFDASYWIIKEAFEHQSPKLVYIDIYTLLPQSSNCYANEVYYIAGDMLSEPQTLEVYEAFMRNSTKYVCFGKLRGVTPEGEYKYELLSCDTDYDKLKQFDAHQTLNHLFKRNYLPAPAAFYKAAVFEKFGYHDEEIRLIEDYPYWMMLAQRGETFGYLDHYTVEYKLSGVTSSGEYSAGFMKDLCLIYEKYIYPYDQRFGIGQKFYNALKQGGLNYYSTRAVFKNMTKGQKAAAYVKYAPFYAFTTLQQKMNDLKNRKASADHDRHD